MGQRLDPHTLLLTLAPKAYFQPPSNVLMEYPCILYEWDDEWVLRANDKKYLAKRRYMVTVIDRDPDSAIPAALGELDFARFNRHYVVDKLHHFVFNVYF